MADHKGRLDMARESGPTGIARRFADKPISTEPDRQREAVKVLAQAEKAAKPLAKPKPKDDAKPKRGRPVAPKPWEAEGISRMTWYRRQKAEKS